MATATDTQIQTFANERIRPFCEALRALQIEAASIKASIDDIYTALTVQNPTWVDNRPDGPPHLLTPSDVLAVNTAITDFLAWQAAEAQWPVILKACVRPPAAR